MGWGYYGFRPYVPVAQRHRQAQNELEKMRKKGLVVQPIKIDGRLIAKTFWGKAWCENLESYSDFENRLPRGRTYARNGSVVHLEIQSGRISAKVSGSDLYSVEITIATLPDPHWKGVKSRCAGQIGSLVELLQGRLSKGVMDIVTQRGEGLFPKPAEIKMKCSCPDSAGMCKHIAAVMYGVGARLDHQPELLFLLRKVDHLELIAGAVDSTAVADATKSRGKKTIATADLADVFGIEMAEAEAPAVEAAPVAATKAPAKSRVSAAKTASKKKPKAAVVVAKKSVKASPAKRKETKKATATSKKASAPRAKAPARSRVKQTAS